MKAINFPARAEVAFGILPDPVAGAGEVVVEVRASGICHTDFEVLNANYGTSAFPVVPGHEYSGIVADVGQGVAGLSVGDRVVVDPNLECGDCRACRRGWAHLCEKLGAYGVTRERRFRRAQRREGFGGPPDRRHGFRDGGAGRTDGLRAQRRRGRA